MPVKLSLISLLFSFTRRWRLPYHLRYGDGLQHMDTYLTSVAKL